MRQALSRLAVPCLTLSLLSSSALAQESRPAWRQLGGPTRDFRVASAELADRWPDGGPRRLWSRTLGEGYSSILVEGDTLVTMYRDDDREVVVALDAGTGATRWEHAYEAPLAHNGYVDVWLNAAGPGPYSTPLIAGGTVFAVGIDGAMHALDLETGAMRWSHDLVARFELSEYNAFAASPLPVGDTLVLPLGGSAAGVVALDRGTGDLVWQSEPFPVAPGSPVPITVDGQAQLVVVGQQELVGLAPEDGRVLWRHPHPNELGLNLSMPVWDPAGLLFVSSAYDGGSRVLRLSATAAPPSRSSGRRIGCVCISATPCGLATSSSAAAATSDRRFSPRSTSRPVKRPGASAVSPGRTCSRRTAGW